MDEYPPTELAFFLEKIPKSVLADLACMLLSNMTKTESICVKILDAQTNALPDLTQSTRLVDHLVEAFHAGHKKAYNPEAEYNFLASVFSNLSGVSGAII